VVGQTFARCSQFAPPTARSVQLGALRMQIDGRALTITAPSATRVAAFTGPVGATFAEEDLAHLGGSGAQLALYLGGLGDTEDVARINLTRVAALRLPTLFIAGGDDRVPVLTAAFESLDDTARDYVVHASGVRVLLINGVRFAVVAGAALGRYARDPTACGFTEEDLTEVRAALGGDEPPWLLSWHAPAGRGATAGVGLPEVGSPELAAAFVVRGAVSAFPEVLAGRPMSAAHALVVPRLSRTGIIQGDGSRLGAAVALLSLTPNGLVQTP
jgi:hypothetical protein